MSSAERTLNKETDDSLTGVEALFTGSVTPPDDLKPKRDFGFYALRLFALFNVGFILFQIIGLIARAEP
jgi:hypothetical protein